MGYSQLPGVHYGVRYPLLPGRYVDALRKESNSMKKILLFTLGMLAGAAACLMAASRLPEGCTDFSDKSR